MNKLDIQRVRSQFPALSSGYIFADNAGGSQITRGVVDRISDYLLYTNVQLNAGYSASIKSTQRVVQGREVAAKLFNATGPEEIIYGGSSTGNMEILTKNMERDIEPGDEFILMSGEHEANNGIWKKLATRCSANIKYWEATPNSARNPFSISHKVEDLIRLVSPKTRIVAFSACSNVLGSVILVGDVSKAVRAAAREEGTKKVEISVDCVAYAPHRHMDVREWDIDFAVISFYKMYGPHVAAIYIRSPELRFKSSLLAHELVYGCTGVLPYLLSLTPAGNLQTTFDDIATHEQTLVQPLLAFLTHPTQYDRGVRIVGHEEATLLRVPTISFVVRGTRPIDSKEVVRLVNKHGEVGIRWYSYTCPAVDEPPLEDGVVRISLVHYNTIQEVERIIDILKEVLA